MDEALRARKERELAGDLRGVFRSQREVLAANYRNVDGLARQAADVLYKHNRETAQWAVIALWLLLLDEEEPPKGLLDFSDKIAAANARAVAINMAQNVVTEMEAKAKAQAARTETSTVDVRTHAEEVLSESRAELIAVTETTRANSMGEWVVEREVNKHPDVKKRQELDPKWRTEKDDRVCPICRPLDGTGRAVWEREFPYGPPSHPMCRCVLLYT